MDNATSDAEGIASSVEHAVEEDASSVEHAVDADIDAVEGEKQHATSATNATHGAEATHASSNASSSNATVVRAGRVQEAQEVNATHSSDVDASISAANVSNSSANSSVLHSGLPDDNSSSNASNSSTNASDIAGALHEGNATNTSEEIVGNASMREQHEVNTCASHMKEFADRLVKHYTHEHLQGALLSYCRNGNEFPHAKVSKDFFHDFKSLKECEGFAKKLVAANDAELSTGCTQGYVDFCSSYLGYDTTTTTPPTTSAMPEKGAAFVLQVSSWAGTIAVLASCLSSC